MSERPTHPEPRVDHPEPPVDVMGDILEAVRLRTAVFGRLELGTPWRLRVPDRAYLSFYVVARGSAWLEVGAGSPGASDTEAVSLSAGDAVLLPHGTAHVVRDSEQSTAPPEDFDYSECPRVQVGEVRRFGGTGPVTSLITGHFTFSAASRNALLASLPRVIQLPADAPKASPQLAGVVPLIVSESAAPGPGSAIVLARLADLLLVHALRLWSVTNGQSACGLRALRDPAIGAALRLIHGRPAEHWTVARLALAVAMSRSGFAARFTELVGEPPLKYLARWRMTLASQLLRETSASIPEVAMRVGYANAVAFAKAFARLQGTGPGAYRREQSA